MLSNTLVPIVEYVDIDNMTDNLYQTGILIFPNIITVAINEAKFKVSNLKHPATHHLSTVNC